MRSSDTDKEAAALANNVDNDETRGASNSPESHDAESHSEQPAQPPYTIFNTPQKHFISLTASFAGMMSTLCSYIYYPALVPIAEDLNVSVGLVNLTITSYLAISAVAPAFMGDMADQSGRRPIYGLMFLMFIGANVGIAINDTYGGLVVLRMLQSAGSSGKEEKIIGNRWLTASSQGSLLSPTES